MNGEGLNNTPRSERLHIALFGRRNAGKSSLINALTGQKVALVSDVPGTTTDPVHKSMEIMPLGPCVLIDTAGFDDEGKVGELRKQRTQEVLKQTDIAILVTDGNTLVDEAEWAGLLKQSNVPYIAVLNKTDLMNDVPSTLLAGMAKQLGCDVIPVSALSGKDLMNCGSPYRDLCPTRKSTASLDGLPGKVTLCSWSCHRIRRRPKEG